MLTKSFKLNFALELSMNKKDKLIFELLSQIQKGKNLISDYDNELILKAFNIGYIKFEGPNVALTDFGIYSLKQLNLNFN